MKALLDISVVKRSESEKHFTQNHHHHGTDSEKDEAKGKSIILLKNLKKDNIGFCEY